MITVEEMKKKYEAGEDITAEYFKNATGDEPINDDLERSNCRLNKVGHWCCGWNWEQNLPRFMHR